MRFLKRYLLLLIPSLLIGDILWESVVHRRLYVCTDYIPIASFKPPFVHGPAVRDYYIAPKEVVYAVYGCFLAAIISIPAIIAQMIPQRKRSQIAKI